MSEPSRILIVRMSHMGDVCHALPVYHALRTRYPHARLAWVVQPEFAPLLEGLPGLEQVLLFERNAGWRAFPRVRTVLRAFLPELAVDAQSNLKSAFVTRLSGAQERLGMARKDWREQPGAFLMTRRAAPAAGPHALDRVAALCAEFGAGVDVTLPLSEDEFSAGREALVARLPDRGRPRRILHLAAEGDRRSWPVAHFADLARRLTAAGEDVLCLSGPSEAGPGRQLAARLGDLDGACHWVEQRGLRALASLFAAAGEAGVRVLACDSGPCHVAAAAGAAVDLLSGPQDPASTGPWPPPDRTDSPHTWLRAPAPERRMESLEPGVVSDRLLEAGRGL